MLFVGDSAIIVSGSHVANLLAMSGCLLAISAVSSRLAIAVAIFQCSYSFLLYGVYAKASPPPGFLPEGVLQNGELILLVLALIGFAATLRMVVRMPQAASEPVGR